MAWQPRPVEALKPGTPAPRFSPMRAALALSVRELAILGACTGLTTASWVVALVWC